MADQTLFGITSAMGGEAKVYYESVFNTAHLGRISDLLCARLRDERLDELAFRRSLLETLFEGYRRIGPVALEQTDESRLRPLTRLNDPLVVECGVLPDQVGVGVSFVLQEEWLSAFSSRDDEGKTGIRSFDEWVERIRSSCDELQIRFEPESRRMHCAALLSLNAVLGGTSAEATRERAQLKWVEVASADLSAPTKAREYEALGDMDYESLLATDSMKVNKPKLAEALAEKTLPGDRQSESSTTVKGKAESDDSSTRVEGATEERNEEVQVVKGKEQKKKGWKGIFGGGEEKSGSDKTVISADKKDLTKEYESQIHALKRRLAEFEARDASSAKGRGHSSGLTVVKGGQPDAATPDLEVTSQINPEIAPENSEEADSEEEDSENAIVAYVKKLLGMGKKPPEAPAPPAAVAPPPTEEAAPPAEVASVNEEPIEEVSMEGMDRVLKKLQVEVEDANPKAKRVYEGLMTEIVQERGRLQELTKKVSLGARQKEHELNNQMLQIQQQLRASEEASKQKDFMIARMKDQIVQLQQNFEKSKAANASGEGDAAGRGKMAHMQKMANAAKDENRALALKLDEMKKKMVAMEMAGRTRTSNTAELSALQAKFDRATKQSDDLKKTNQLLTEKMVRLEERMKNGMPGSSNDETKKRLESAVRQLTVQKKEAERLAARIVEMQREDMRMKAEVNRLTNELKKSKPASAASAAPPPAPTAATPPVAKAPEKKGA